MIVPAGLPQGADWLEGARGHGLHMRLASPIRCPSACILTGTQVRRISSLAAVGISDMSSLSTVTKYPAGNAAFLGLVHEMPRSWDPAWVQKRRRLPNSSHRSFPHGHPDTRGLRLMGMLRPVLAGAAVGMGVLDLLTATLGQLRNRLPDGSYRP